MTSLGQWRSHLTDADRPARAFRAHRGHLRSVAFRMLGSLAEADDAVEEAWLRTNRSGADEVRDLLARLTTVVVLVAPAPRPPGGRTCCPTPA